jgi:hypothetical protein
LAIDSARNRGITVKKCPVCNRFYDDATLNFCLEDGALLSATDDPDKTQQISAPHETNSILTRVSYPTANVPNDTQPLRPTMPSPQIHFDSAANAPAQTRTAGTGSKIWLAAGLLALLMVSLAAIIIWFNSANTPANTNIIAKNQNDNRIISNNSSQDNKKSDTIFGPLDYNASLNGENLTYYPGTTVEKCQADCAKNEKCKGFTFIRAGAYNPNDSAMCYLASVVTGSAYHVCCVSGIKR